MKDKVLATVIAAVHDMRLPGHLYGTGALMVCAAKAIEHERNGDPWTPASVMQEYAEEKGYIQHTVWVNIQHALEHGRGPASPAKAIKAIVKGAYHNGCLEDCVI